MLPGLCALSKNSLNLLVGRRF